MTHSSEWDMVIWWPEVENAEGRHISVSHERLCVICFVVWPTTHKMAAWELCLQDGGVSEGLPTRWRCGSFAYNMAAFLRVFPQDGGNAKQIKRKQKQRRICFKFRIYLDVRHWTVWRSTVARWTVDNAQHHVTAFRPISEAARSWSYDKC